MFYDVSIYLFEGGKYKKLEHEPYRLKLFHNEHELSKDNALLKTILEGTEYNYSVLSIGSMSKSEMFDFIKNICDSRELIKFICELEDSKEYSLTVEQIDEMEGA